MRQKLAVYRVLAPARGVLQSLRGPKYRCGVAGSNAAAGGVFARLEWTARILAEHMVFSGRYCQQVSGRSIASGRLYLRI